MAGRLYETDYMLTNEETRSGIASFDVDGGAPLTLGAVVSTDKACKTIGKYATGNKTVYIAYNPSFSYVLEDGQKVNPQLEGGVYTNIAGTTVSAFRPRTGDEFAVIMPETDADQAGQATARLRAAMMHDECIFSGKVINFSVSIGTATYSPALSDELAFFDLADKRLYEDKKMRNR